MLDDYYTDLIDPARATSATAVAHEHERVKRIEEARFDRLTSPIQNQTTLLAKTIDQHEKVIKELEEQNENFKKQIAMLQKSESDAKRKAHYSLFAFVITTIISLVSLLVAIFK